MPDKSLAPVLFIPHGGGPLPLLNEPGHASLVEFLKQASKNFKTPEAILLISAHWEAKNPTITAAASPELIYDYYGFPPESYEIQYPAPGAPALASKIHALLQTADMNPVLDETRGFDHGLFVPLKLMYPQATIPCVQLSLLNSLDPVQHIAMGKALSALRAENILIVGSGFSFHNLRAMMSGSIDESKNQAFEQWLKDTCTGEMVETDRAGSLQNWKSAPGAIYCHPREEHLLPLHVCYGVAQSAGRQIYSDSIFGVLASAYLWN